MSEGLEVRDVLLRKGTGMLERMEGPGCSGQAGEDVHLFLQVVPPRS